MKYAQIDLYSHFFKVSKVHPLFKLVIWACTQELLQVQYFKVRGKVQKQATKVYMTSNAEKTEFRMHINFYEQFKHIALKHRMNVDDPDMFDIIEHEMYKPQEAKLKMADWFEVREYQNDVIDYCLEDGISKLITLSMGYGKTGTSLKLAEIIGKKLLIIVLGRYMEKWTEDIIGAYGKDSDYVIIRGTKDLLKILEHAKYGGEPPDVTLISTTTLQIYIKNWEQATFEEKEQLIPPEDICKVLGIGTRIIDEVHQHFHANFKMDLYLHCPKTIYLTGTLFSADKFLMEMYYLMFPLSMRNLSEIKAKAYDNVYALHFTHLHPDRVKCIGSQGYSHVKYEQSLWRHIPSRVAYLDLIGNVVEQRFLPIYQPGRKMLIFCALVDTCLDVAEYLNGRFKDQNWKISKFTAEDPKEVIDTNDITVSTLGKSGTALDIPGLVICLMTNALSEQKANLQAKGRNRDLSKKPGFENIVPEFWYFVGDDIEKHVQYHRDKQRLFEGKTLVHKDEYYRTPIGTPIHQLYPHGLPDYHKKSQPMKA